MGKDVTQRETGVTLKAPWRSLPIRLLGGGAKDTTVLLGGGLIHPASPGDLRTQIKHTMNPGTGISNPRILVKEAYNPKPNISNLDSEIKEPLKGRLISACLSERSSEYLLIKQSQVYCLPQ